MSLSYNGNLIPRAKNLRKNMTRQENHLWYDFLSKYPIRFQRQKTIGNFIVDFYCASAKLIIELDGSQHYSEKRLEYDSERTEILESSGLKVIRFTNIEIDTQFDSVCLFIDNEIKTRRTSHDKLRILKQHN